MWGGKWRMAGGFFVLVLLAGTSAYGQGLPTLDEAFWGREADLATGKMRRGAGLGVLGVVATVPTGFLVAKAGDDPEGYAAYSALASLATVGMIMHGFASVEFGREQRERADDFVAVYRDGSGIVDQRQERDFYRYARRKTAAKVIIFGGTLGAGASISLTNGIVRSARRHDGTSTSEVAIWPSYVIGGALLPMAVAVVLMGGRRYREVSETEITGANSSPKVSMQPFFTKNQQTGETQFGLFGQFVF